jgi:hypothetical protein
MQMPQMHGLEELLNALDYRLGAEMLQAGDQRGISTPIVFFCAATTLEVYWAA